MVGGRTACDRLVRRLVSYGEPEGVRSRLGIGMFLLRRAYKGLLSGEATRELPVDGIKEGLVAHGQAGQFYRQAATGRMESAVEAKDNVAAFACGKVLLDRSQRRISRREAAKRLREILAE